MTTQTLTATSIANIRTEKARNYLIQLCKHFAHKIEATYADNRGRIVFGAGVCELNADDPAVLVAQVSTPDPAQLTTLEDAIECHLKRFAFKEELGVQWVRED
jgi:hypothetical protein